MKKPTLKKLLIFQEMKLFNHKLKKLLFFSFFFRRTPYGFSSLFLQIFSFHHWFLLFLLGAFIADCICSLHHCFFKWFFYFTTDFTIAFSSVFISPTFFTMTVFFFFSGVSFLCCCTACATDLRELFFLLAVVYLHSFLTFGTTYFYQCFPGAGNSALNVAGPSTEVRNTDPVHLFVWITQGSAKGISR